MITPVAQRWRDRRGSYRPAGETIRTSAYEVAEIHDDSTAKAFVEVHHYSACYPAARARFGLYRAGALVGVVVFSQPVNAATLVDLPGDNRAELGRLVLLDDVPANGESWFIARAFEQLRRDGYTGIVSFSDPMPRDTATGDVVFPGHIGTIYQASNAVYLGTSKRSTLHLLPDGRVFSRRAQQKIRAKERGWRYAVEQLLEAGAPEPAGDLRAWLPVALAAVTRRRRHPGNHRYVWALQPRDRRHLPDGQRYPKLDVRAA